MTKHVIIVDDDNFIHLIDKDYPAEVEQIISIAKGDLIVHTEEEPITFQWPTEYPGVVTQPFGANPQIYGQWNLPGHEGIDMRARGYKKKIFAVWDGTVSRVGWHRAYGNHIRIKHNIRGIEYESVYAHFEKPSAFRKGEWVSKGSVIGIAGSTGNSSATHLHFSLKQWSGDIETDFPYNLIDPTLFFEELR